MSCDQQSRRSQNWRLMVWKLLVLCLGASWQNRCSNETGGINRRYTNSKHVANDTRRWKWDRIWLKCQHMLELMSKGVGQKITQVERQDWSRSGKHPKYPDFVKSQVWHWRGSGRVELPTGFYPFFEGIIEMPKYIKKSKEMNKKTVTYMGQGNSFEATQYQWDIERKIRFETSEAALQAGGMRHLKVERSNSGNKPWRVYSWDWMNRQSVREQIIKWFLKQHLPNSFAKDFYVAEPPVRDVMRVVVSDFHSGSNYALFLDREWHGIKKPHTKKYTNQNPCAFESSVTKLLQNAGIRK